MSRNFVTLENGIVTNVIVAEKEFADKIGAIFVSDLPITFGDRYDEQSKEFICTRTEYIEPTDDTQTEIITREVEHRYAIPTYIDVDKNKNERELCYRSYPIVNYDDRLMTVDQANDLWLKYSAEKNKKADELSVLIAEAKCKFREMYPEGEGGLNNEEMAKIQP